MSTLLESERLARRGAGAILAAFEDYRRQFRDITRGARATFERRDWHGMQHDAGRRLGLYDRIVAQIVAEIRALRGPEAQDRGLWGAMKTAYAEQVPTCAAIELAETFFNSVTRRLC